MRPVARAGSRPSSGCSNNSRCPRLAEPGADRRPRLDAGDIAAGSGSSAVRRGWSRPASGRSRIHAEHQNLPWHSSRQPRTNRVTSHRAVSQPCHRIAEPGGHERTRRRSELRTDTRGAARILEDTTLCRFATARPRVQMASLPAAHLSPIGPRVLSICAIYAAPSRMLLIMGFLFRAPDAVIEGLCSLRTVSCF
jgi:hypothetical protein